MTQAEVLALCERYGAYLEGHFCLSSGLHSPKYVQCALVLAEPAVAERLGRELAAICPGAPADFVAAPALSGLIIGHEVARALGCRFLFAERNAGGAMTLRRGFTMQAGERGVVIEDVITTGGSTRETIAAMEAVGARIAGAGAIIDRSGGAVQIGVPHAALVTLDVPVYAPESCPLCAAGLPLVKPGSRPGAGARVSP